MTILPLSIIAFILVFLRVMYQVHQYQFKRQVSRAITVLDSIWQTQSLYAFTQTIQLIGMAHANETEDMGKGRLEMRSGTQMPVSARMGFGLNTGDKGYPTIPLTMAAVDPAIADLPALVGASQGRPYMGITGTMEGLEHDPITARSIAAVNVKYDNRTSESREDNEKMLKSKIPFVLRNIFTLTQRFIFRCEAISLASTSITFHGIVV